MNSHRFGLGQFKKRKRDRWSTQISNNFLPHTFRWPEPESDWESSLFSSRAMLFDIQNSIEMPWFWCKKLSKCELVFCLHFYHISQTSCFSNLSFLQPCYLSIFPILFVLSYHMSQTPVVSVSFTRHFPVWQGEGLEPPTHKTRTFSETSQGNSNHSYVLLLF